MDQNIQKLLVFAVFASYIASILNESLYYLTQSLTKHVHTKWHTLITCLSRKSSPFPLYAVTR